MAKPSVNADKATRGELRPVDYENAEPYAERHIDPHFHGDSNQDTDRYRDGNDDPERYRYANPLYWRLRRIKNGHD